MYIEKLLLLWCLVYITSTTSRLHSVFEALSPGSRPSNGNSPGYNQIGGSKSPPLKARGITASAHERLVPNQRFLFQCDGTGGRDCFGNCGCTTIGRVYCDRHFDHYSWHMQRTHTKAWTGWCSTFCHCGKFDFELGSKSASRNTGN
jgi:hypothetical protein